jgi:alkaline phosphatase
VRYRRTTLVLVAAALACPVAAAERPVEWFARGREAVERAKRVEPTARRAKNVILFVGDGMGVSTVTAARILDGQLRGETGEENLLSFEKLPYLALAKTYNTDLQVPDSAGTMTAMMTGTKTKAGVIAVNENVVRGDFASAAGNELVTLLEICEQGGLSTGVVTTTRLTHATPASCYAHSPERGWEDDSDLPSAARAAHFPDIARQFIEFPHGNGLDLALGGGRRQFLPKTNADPEYPGQTGSRNDGRDLTAEWSARTNAAYVWNKSGFDAIDPAKTDRLLGLFEPSHMQYEHDRTGDPAGEPSLTEMTEKAIDILTKNPKGFFLMVEGGRIDHAHHAANAYRALTDTIEFARAVGAAIDRIGLSETLVIVTADHSHVFTMAGYPARGNPILGKVAEGGGHAHDALGKPYTTLGYANGPGYTGASSSRPEGPKAYPHYGRGYQGITNGRPDLSDVDTGSPSYVQECTVPLGSETHGGEDVAVYAGGPHAHLVRGVQEQNFIFHVMAEALGIRGERTGDARESGP